MTLWTWVMFAAGAALLIVGAELLVRGASRLAVAAGISPLVVGLTVVAFGTSAPELAVTVGSAVAGEADLALGNVVGSNIFNILFILGLSALVVPLVVAEQLVRIDVPLVIGASILVLVLGLDGSISRLDGTLLFGLLLVYTFLLVRATRRSSAAERSRTRERTLPDGQARGGALLKNLALIVIGLVLLVVGADWLVDAAVSVAVALGVSSLVIGLTIVAAGTSLPEVATSLLAAVRGQRDIAVGNAVGSCLFNLLSVLGLGSLIAPGGIPVAPGALRFDIPVMIAVAVAALPIFFTGYTIARWEGAVFLGYYVAYTVYLVMDATGHHALASFRAAMGGFVIPLTVITLTIGVVRALRSRARAAPG